MARTPTPWSNNSTPSAWGRLDGLVNNASVFYPTPVAGAVAEDWDRILHTNLRAPFFLLQNCLPALTRNGGCVINLIDIYSEKPLPEHPLYCASKAGLAAMTRSWARDLAPAIRVNGVSPGAILWPEGDTPVPEQYQQSILEKTPLARTGKPADIARSGWRSQPQHVKPPGANSRTGYLGRCSLCGYNARSFSPPTARSLQKSRLHKAERTHA